MDPKLYWKIEELILIASHNPDDDFLFLDKDTLKTYAIHPTWSGKTERRNWPIIEKYKNLEEWIKERLIPDQEYWYSNLSTEKNRYN